MPPPQSLPSQPWPARLCPASAPRLGFPVVVVVVVVAVAVAVALERPPSMRKMELAVRSRKGMRAW